MTGRWRGWLRRRDPDLIAVHRAVRVTTVASLAFYVAYYVLGDRDIATYGLFAAVAMGSLAQVPGPARHRAVTLLRSVPIALLLVGAGTLLAGNLWAASVGMLVFGFVIAFAAAGGPTPAGIAAGLQLFFILACFPPYAPQTLTSRLIGVLAGMGILAVAELILWPDRGPVPYERRLADASEKLANDLRARATGQTCASGRIDWPSEATWPPGLPPAARPTSAGRRGRALTEAGQALSFTLARLRDLPDDARPPPVVAEPLNNAADAARAVASALRGGAPPPTKGLQQALRSAQTRRAEDAEQATASARYLAAAQGVWSLASAVRMFLDAPTDSAGRGSTSRWWQRFAVHLTPRSIYFQGAVRIALALLAARLVAGTLELSHGFWVLLATLTLLRGRAAATGMTLGPASIGTVAGAAVAGALLVVVGPHRDIYAAITPPVMALAFAAGALFGLAWGQALFTVLVTLVFTQLTPSGVQLAEVRVVDVMVGALIGVTAGVLAWPRGASAELHRSAGRLLDASGALVRDTARALAGSPTDPDPAALPRVRDAMELMQAAFGAYELERRKADEPTPNWGAVLTVGDHAVRGTTVLLDTHEPGSAAPWRPVVIGWADTVADDCATTATALHERRTPASLSTVVGPPPDMMVGDIYVWLAGMAGELSRVSASAAPR